MGLLGSLFNPTGSFDSGDWGLAGADAIAPGAFGGGTLSPQYSTFYNEGQTPSWYDSLYGRSQMSDWADDVGDFGSFQLGSWDDQFRRNPAQAAVGAGDPIATKMWNEVLHKDWKPMVSSYGGPTQQTFYNADKAGVDTSNMRGIDNTVRAIAPAVASYFGGPLAGAAMSGLGTWGDALESGEEGWKSFGDGLGAFGKSALSSIGMPDWWKMAGGTSGVVGNVANSTANGALMGAATGGSGTEGAKSGLTSGLLNAGLNMGKSYLNSPSNDIPDEGTLGGTMRDEYGETDSPRARELQGQSNLDVVASKDGGYVPQILKQQSADAGNQPQAAPSNAFSDFLGAFSKGSGPTGTGPSYLDLAGNALGMYNAYSNRRRLGNELNTLRDMFSNNSAYAQQMRSNMARQDAARGRRSNAAGREVALQAKLAEAALRNQPQTMAILSAQDEQARRMAGNAIQGATRLGQMYFPQQQQQAPIRQQWNPPTWDSSSMSTGLLGQLFGGY
jgi:hypothetical protein